MDLLEKEREFCSNFKCCDVKLSDLHALFDHLENCHPGSDICDLSFSVPSGPSSTGAVSDVLQIPAPPASSRKLKSLFTRVPLPPIPPVSPVTSDSSWSSIPEPPPTPASRPEKPPPPPCVSRYVQGPSAITRDKIYTPVAVPSTLRMDQPPTPLSWSVAAPAAFYPEAMGYGYGYFYYPASPPAPHIPVPIPVRAPAPSIPANVEIIDVDLISSPPRAATTFSLPGTSVPPTGARSAPTFAPLRTLAPARPSAPLYTSTSLSPASTSAQASSSTFSSLSTSASAPPPPLSTPASALPSLALPLPPTTPFSQATTANPDSSLSPLPQPRNISESPAPSINALRNCFFGSARVLASGSRQGDFAIADGQNEDAACTADAVMLDGVVGAAADTSVLAACDECEARGGSVDFGVVLDVVESRGPAEASKNQDSRTEERDDNEGSEHMNEDVEVVVMQDGGEFESIQDAQILTKPALYLNGREKSFVCPTPLCVKAYLNPGGLRYHARQGTCVMENGQPCPSPLSPSLVDDMLLSAGCPAPTTPKKANGKRGAAWRRAPGSRTSSRLAPVSEKPTITSTRTCTSVKTTSKANTKSKSKASATAAKSKSKSKSKAQSKSTSVTPAPASPFAYSSRDDGYDSEMLSSDEDAEESD
ncbi:hypothetical protein C8R47DRAFT_55547 [Mycena vitilis]|nr:hypothetical protein C8R47DRAFT_55547 [Mycena vitilis]